MTLSKLLELLPGAHVENAKVTSVRVGSAFHDCRGFLTVGLEGPSWGQACTPRFAPEEIDHLISLCGAAHLFDCEGRLARVIRVKSHGFIDALAPIVNDKPVLPISSTAIEAIRHATGRGADDRK